MPLVVAAACVLAIACAVVILESQPTGIDSGGERESTAATPSSSALLPAIPGCVLSTPCELPRAPVRVILPWVPVGYLTVPIRDQLKSGRNGVVAWDVYEAVDADVPSPSGPVKRSIQVVLSDHNVPTAQLPKADWIEDHIGSLPVHKWAGTGSVPGLSANVSQVIVELGPDASLSLIGEGLTVDDLMKVAGRAAVL